MAELVPEEKGIRELPVLPLKNTVLFPNLILPLAVGRDASRAAVDAALGTEEKEIVVVTQRDSDIQEPTQSDLYTIGTRAVIKRSGKSSENVIDLIVLGVERCVVLKVEQYKPFMMARVRSLPSPTDNSPELEALQPVVVDLATKGIGLANPQGLPEMARILGTTEDPLQLAWLLASSFSMDVEKAQSLLETETRVDAMRQILRHLSYEVQVLELRSKIASEAQHEMSKEQREYLLRRQLKAIQQELGETDPSVGDIEELEQRMEEADLPEEVRKEANRELGRLRKIPPSSPDHQVIRTYLDLVLELPWNVSTEDQLDIKRARQILDEDHFGLEDVKERILEQLGVLQRNPKAKAPILCFVGPPGVGKTSLGHSIARSLGRKFERMSLGGVHDEAELRGHRRTYIGALPGRLIQAIRRSEAKNPVLMLDEVDKLGRDFRGDPSSALLEVLDPEQNNTFRDNYLDLPFDLSKVLFITTANTLETIPQPLLDRMEVLRLSGYSEEEKISIARKYLIPRQLKEAGLDEEQCSFPDDGLMKIIDGYTREAGLRNLERTIARLCRKVTLQIAEGKAERVALAPDKVSELLGPVIFMRDDARKVLPPGVATGLAWTPVGGDVLYVEGTLLPNGRGLTLTGQLGEVMQESARAAQSFLWAHANEYGIDPSLFRRAGVHIHVPSGAIPKDGPSAGITAAVALASLYTSKPVRSDTAMTGEITLSGLVLPIGGVKEKVMAARRAGIKRVILPKANEKDLTELPDDVRSEMEFLFAGKIDEVFSEALPDLMQKDEPEMVARHMKN